MSDMDELASKQDRATKQAMAISKMTDPDEILKASAALAELAKDMEKTAARLEARFGGADGPEERVVLLPDQRERLAEVTGVAMDMLVVRDKDGGFARAMPTTDRATIERMAARQTANIAVKKAKDKAIEELIKALEALEVPELKPIIECIKRDPTLQELTKMQTEFGEEMKAKYGSAQGQG